MKFTMKRLAKAWVTIGGIMVTTDLTGFATCKVLEKIGKPSKTLSMAYNDMFDYKSAKNIAIKWITMYYMWPVTIAASIKRVILYNNKKKEEKA